MIDEGKVREWKDVHFQMAELHRKDSVMFNHMLDNFKRVFQKKLDRFGEELRKAKQEAEAVNFGREAAPVLPPVTGQALSIVYHTAEV